VYDVDAFNGTKTVILTTSSALGRSPILGYVFIGGAGLCLLLVITMLLLYVIKRNPLSNYENLSWE
jgi:hypothetical protein